MTPSPEVRGPSQGALYSRRLFTNEMMIIFTFSLVLTPIVQYTLYYPVHGCHQALYTLYVLFTCRIRRVGGERVTLQFYAFVCYIVPPPNLYASEVVLTTMLSRLFGVQREKFTETVHFAKSILQNNSQCHVLFSVRHYIEVYYSVFFPLCAFKNSSPPEYFKSHKVIFFYHNNFKISSKT